VELALVLPLVLMFALLIAQFGVVVREQMDAWHLAREAARAVALAENPQSTIDDLDDMLKPPAGFDIRATIDDALATVTVTRTVRTDLPMIGAVVPDFTVRAEVTMALEVPVAS
jgi:hypothetical protein